jgi:hypothetical protein
MPGIVIAQFAPTGDHLSLLGPGNGEARITCSGPIAPSAATIRGIFFNALPG